MNNIWELKKLIEVCSVIAGQSPEGKYYNANSDGLPFYQGKKGFKDRYIGEPTKWTRKVTKEAIAGDILMSVRAPVGPVNFSTQRICIGRGLAAIRATELIDKNFLFYFFIKHENEIVGNEGAVFNSINKTQIENLKIPLPPLPEQKRIVKILDEAFAAIDKAKSNAEKNLQNSRELFDSYLNKVFANPGKDWEEKKLKNIIKLEYGKPLDKTKREIKGLYPVYGANGEKARSNEYYFDKKSIIVGRKGSAGEINITTEKFWPLDVTYFVTFDERRYDLKFLFYLLNTLNLPRLARGVKPGINRNDVYSLGVLIPSLPEQKQMVEKLDGILSESKKLEAIYQQKLSDLEELKKSILQKAFDGELTRNNG